MINNPTRDNAIHDLVESMCETLKYFEMPEARLNSAYAPGKWTARFILVHLADTEAVLLERLKRLASETSPTLMAFDQDRWAENLFYATRDIGLARLQFESARRGVLELIRSLPAGIESKSGTHSEAGTRSFGQIQAMILSHSKHHNEQLKAIAEGRTWTPAPK